LLIIRQKLCENILVCLTTRNIKCQYGVYCTWYRRCSI